MTRIEIENQIQIIERELEYYRSKSNLTADEERTKSGLEWCLNNLRAALNQL